MFLTLLTDIIHFAIYYPTADLVGRDMYRFSAGMAILSLLLKPISCFFVYQMYRERGGEYNVNFGKCYNFIYCKKHPDALQYLLYKCSQLHSLKCMVEKASRLQSLDAKLAAPSCQTD